ncbi:hypothetical protein J5N97_016095 [Dioscorea zingiberensis]|uniref:Uncharacterized protein n=1 Tax=Dioscorea zingiberensis TaxID=325984 RepID=A0A9D5HF32_9LILI|nr:hypothetical protein J5N97_016095 [Dioscorea zingiberensis]
MIVRLRLIWEDNGDMPLWLSRKIWAVVLPCGYHNSMNTLKLELAIYPDWKTAQPIIALRDVHIEEPDTSHPDPTLIIVDNATKEGRRRIGKPRSFS